jgi:hypothetical protein
MIHTDGKPTISSRTEPVDALRKAAFRLKKLAPVCYERAVAAGTLPDVGRPVNFEQLARTNQGLRP